MKILFAASECAPIVKIGGLGDVVGSLPKALAKLGVEVAIILPKYRLKGSKHPETLPGTKIPVFYVENDQVFGDGTVYPGAEAEHERFAYFSRAVVDFLDTRVFEPEVLHCHDYHTSLIPNLLKSQRKKVATLLTIHDLSNQGLSSPAILETARLSVRDSKLLDWDLTDRNLEMILQGIVAADVINTVSPTYATEILTPARGEGLAEVLRAREARLFGVLNGIDNQAFDPVKDAKLAAKFPHRQVIGEAISPALLKAKAANKEALQKRLGLKADGAVPLVGMITRLVERKGVKLVLQMLSDHDFQGVQVVVLGKGEPALEDELLRINRDHPDRISVQIAFDEDLAHLIYAASDLFLVPSLFEPCGLTQMVALRYGAVPVVHCTGGLADTVINGLTGFSFSPYGYAPFKESLQKALEAFSNGQLKQLAAAGLKKDFSWERSALQYLQLYQKALSFKFGIGRGTGGEIRRDLLGDWTILSTLRRSRPDETGSVKKLNSESKTRESESHSSEEEIENCPFEEGHETMSPGEVFRTGSGSVDTPGWQTRVIPNKYPILPAHEVIVHSPSHRKDLEFFSEEQMEALVWTYLSRYRHYQNFGYVHLFCNRGPAAAASLRHPHSQLIVLEEMAKSTLNAIEAAEVFYRAHGLCPYCDLLRRERNGPRFITENESFVLLTPMASDWPYEVSLIPKAHRKSFGNIREAEMKALARILNLTTKIVTKELESVSYNYWIHSLPNLMGLDKVGLYYHWHLDLVPRVKILGGLELGLKLMVDDWLSPESAAEKLRSHMKKALGTKR